MENKNNLIPVEQLEQVSGGVSTAGMKSVGEWNAVCENYECKLCGTHNVLLTGHKDGCAVAAFGRQKVDTSDWEFLGSYVQSLQNVNGCWSCKYAVQGKNFPANRNDLYCGRGH